MAQINIKKNTSASVSTPPAGVQALFIGTDSILYGKSDAGAVTQLAGLTGPAGPAGSAGSSGSSGTSGVAGASGSSGSSGTSGVGSSGSSGTSGVNGNSGSSGTSGVNGGTGSSGTSGANGSSGSSGTSGQAGSSGTSGTSPSGGGAAGLITGSGTYSIQSNPTLTPGATASGEYSISLGGSTASGAHSINIGNNNSDINGGLTKLNNIMIGRNIYMTVSNASAVVDNNILIGNGVSLRPNGGTEAVDNNIIIGNGAYIEGGNANNGVAIGTNAKTGRFNSIAIGNDAQTAGGANIAVSIGSGTVANTETGVAIGYNTSQSGYSVNIGYDGAANGYKAIGLMGRANANYSFAASGGEITTTGGIAIGDGAYSSHTNGVVFGATVSSVAAATTHVNKLYIKNLDVYADNTTAVAGGLVAGQVYRTSLGILMITY